MGNQGVEASSVVLHHEGVMGVLLYYNFVVVPDPHTLKDWFISLCSSHSLFGRIRIAPGGINVTVGGTITSLHEHIKAVDSHPLLGGCDFKLAAIQSNSFNSTLAKEVGFSSLSVRVVKEVVTLGLHPSKYPHILEAGDHLTPVEFHQKIQERVHFYAPQQSSAGNGELVEDGSRRLTGTVQAKLVLLDARNIYETRIGRFVPPQGVDYLDPKVRQYSDLPGWIDSNSEKLQNKCILMYCTGGVRCEMASAYLKNKGKGFENVFQLSGGIQRYLEAFPDGGYFKGKNFVFDHRVAVASTSSEVIGLCMSCGDSFDDYSSRFRCSHCRMLVLICSVCQNKTSCDARNPDYTCELCGVGRKATGVQPQTQQPRLLGMPTNQRLRILCLHGFRQNGSNLKGRLASFTKKLKHIAEFVFVDAPHEIPLIYSPHSKQKYTCQENETGGQVAETEAKVNLPRKKFAWLVTPEMISANSNPYDITHSLEGEPVQISATADEYSTVERSSYSDMEFDRFQYRKQSEGWPTSFARLKRVFSELGPFDGVLGFSQGAAIAASLCLLCEDFQFRFVILCSGFLSPVREHQDLITSSTCLPVNCPSLHLFGDTQGCDRQISTDTSMELLSRFSSDHCMVLKHNSGHIVPSQKEYVNKVKAFLSQFL